jgi:DNA-binding HxlR family transcriptional regulator
MRYTLSIRYLLVTIYWAEQMARKQQYDGPCPIERVINVFGGKWKPAILYHLEQSGTLRFSELRRLIPEVSPKMLTQQLRDLERDGLVNREHFPEIPPRVEYSPTPIALSLAPVAKAIEQWSKKNTGAIHDARKRYDRKR